jgi:uncharacterized damage-inducible protein DinB
MHPPEWRIGHHGGMPWIAPEVKRVDEPFVGDELSMLTGWLEWQRGTLLHKCAGLTGEQLAQWAVPPSNMSLLGLVRHMTEVERAWFRNRFRGEDLPYRYWRDDAPDADFEEVDAARAEGDYEGLTAEWEACREAVAGASLDDTFVGRRGATATLSLRWAYIHMIEEYARHNGHADLLRERIDGVTGS